MVPFPSFLSSGFLSSGFLSSGLVSSGLVLAGVWLCTTGACCWTGAVLVLFERGADGVKTRTGAGLFTTTGDDAGSLWVLSPGMLISEGMLRTVDGDEAAVCSGWPLEFTSITPPNAAAPTTAIPATISRPLLAVADCATGAAIGICCMGIGCCIGA